MNKVHIATAKQLIRQKGRCWNIDCDDCQFSNYEDFYCANTSTLRTQDTHELVKIAKYYYNQNIKQPKFQTYQDVSGQWKWKLIASNGNIMAGGQRYPTKSAVLRAIRTVKRIVKEI